MSIRSLARISLLCLFAASFSFAAAYAPRTVSAAPFPLPPAQSSPEQRVSAITAAEPDISDDFSELTDLWETHYDGETASYYKAGRFHVSVNAENLIAWGTGDISAADFLVEADVSHYDGTLDNRGGLIFRYIDSDNFYFFAVSSDGFYSLRKLVDNEWETLIDWTASEVMSTGKRSTNRLGVLAEGDHITLLVNGEVLAEIDDDSLTEGAIGLAAGTFDEYEVDLTFDNFALWQLPLDSEPDRPSTSPIGRLTPRPDDQTLTVEDRIAAIREETPVFSEDFTAGAGDWDAESSEDTVFSGHGGDLQMEVLPVDWVSYSQTENQFEDFLLELDTTHVAGPLAVEYGTYFRNTDGDNFYYFAVSATGQYNFWKREDGAWKEIIPWTASDALNTGEGAQNRISVLADGSDIALLANDVVLAELEDDSFAAGSIGVLTRTYDEGDVTVAFDNMDVWDLQPPDSSAQPTPVAVPSEIDFAEIEDRMDEIRSMEPLLSEDFRVNRGAWTMDSTDDALFEFLRRSFHISVEKPNWMVWSRYESSDLGDFLFEGEVEATRSPLDGNYGLLFRFQDADNFYIFRISPRGTYNLMKKVGGEWTTLVDWSASDLIDTSDRAVNRLGILADGPKIAVAINGGVVAQIEDADLSSGQAALVAGTFDEPDVEVAFDNVDIWQLDN